MASVKEIINENIADIMQKYHFKTYNDTGKILVYEKQSGIYVPADSTITQICCEDNRGLNTPQLKLALEMNIRGRSYTQRLIHQDKICLNKSILVFRNGIFETESHSPSYVFESKVSIDYIKDANCPVWIETVNNMLPDKKDQLLLQEWFGYHFLPGQLYEKAMFLTGKPSTGKSTTIYVLNQLIGGCCSHHELSEFQNDKNYAIADLYGKIGNTYTDMGNAVISDIGKFKVLTGSNDTVTARFPYERPFNFINPAKLTFASNRLPPLSANVQSDQAYWKRVLLLQYSVVILKKDPELFDKLKSELPGILNWALEGYIRLISNKGEFTKNTEDNYDTWSHSAYSENPLQEFIDEKCMSSSDCWIESNVLRAKYSAWCIEQLEIPITLMEFRSALVLKGIFESRKLNKTTGDRDNIYKGITLIS